MAEPALDDTYQRVLAQFPAAVCVLLGPDHVYDLVNGRYQALFPGRELLGKAVREALPELVGQGAIEGLDRVYRTGLTHVATEVELHLSRTPDGPPEPRYFTYTDEPLLRADGSVQGIIVFTNEVTDQVLERRRAARELERQRDLTTRIVDNASTGISYLNRDLVYEWVNPRQAAFWGVPIERIIGHSLAELFGADAAAQVTPLLRRVIETGEAHTEKDFSFRFTMDGKARESYWDFSYVPIKDEAGEVMGVLSMSLEVSDRVEKERLQREHISSLEEADRLKDQFLSILSHELRTPLNFIMGFASVLKDEVVGPLNDLQHVYADKILSGADVLLALIEDVLTVSRVQAGKFSITPVPSNFYKLVAAALSGQVLAAQKKGITVVNEVSPDLPGVTLDPQRITQVIHNLASNAVKFTPEGGRVTVSAAATGGWLRCEVADTGVGIAAADHGRLFQRFSQLDMSRTRPAGGAGLGLSIVKAIVESHGGRVGVDSQRGQGARFWFELPLATQP